MCGIAGFFDSSLISSVKKELGSKMLLRIRHRGPDASSAYIDDQVYLGHNRLSIIDLSVEADQPFVVDQWVMVYNGEVYNYVEIRNELQALGHKFRTASDTEVILKSFIQWGDTCVDRFVGMWAFVIYNKNSGQLFCSRDRFGIKPFYYIHHGEQFYFASEVKAFYDLPFFNPALNKKQVFRGLNLGWISYHDETYFEQVKALPPAHNLIFNNNTIALDSYWVLEKKELNLSYKQAVDAFKAQFFETVRIHLRSDVKVGACLSGGIDSSSLVATMSKLDPIPLDSFTIYYEGQDAVDERPWVKEVLEAYHNVHPHYFTPSDADIQHAFSKILYHQDAPLPGSSPVSQYFLMQLAGEHKIKVVMDGQGSDEYLLGYLHFYYSIYAQLFKKRQFKTALNTLKNHKRTQGLSFKELLVILGKSGAKYILGEQGYKRKEFSDKYPNVLIDKVEQDLWQSFDNGVPVDSVTQNALFLDTLPSLLHFEDRNSMAFSIESRVPFLDHRLVEMAYSLPYTYKLDDGITKKILRDALKGILPEKIAHRTDKKGFVTPGEIKWLRGPLKHLLATENLTHLGDLCNLDKVYDLIHEFDKGDNTNAQMVWRLIALNEWRKTIPQS